MLRRLPYAVLLGVLGAGIVHVAILLLLPQLGQRDAWTRLSALVQPFSAVRLDAGQNGPIIPALDPFFIASACRFDLAQGPLVVTATGQVPFWSASVIAPDGRPMFSFNDRAREDDALGFIVLTPPQMAERELAPMESGAAAPDAIAIFAEVATPEGMVVVRAFVPDPSFRGPVEAFLSSLTCVPEAG